MIKVKLIEKEKEAEMEILKFNEKIGESQNKE
jgi:hypothetical protein